MLKKRKRRVKKKHLIKAGKKALNKKPKKQTKHQHLVSLAKKYLSKKCSVVVTELHAGFGEVPDAIGWSWGMPFVIECKASRSDFIADLKKEFRTKPETGLGKFRYYLAKEGLIDPELLPTGWGLLEVKKYKTGKKEGKERIVLKRQCDPKYFVLRNIQKEVAILISSIRRIGKSAGKDLKAVSAMVYTHDTKACGEISLCTKLDRDF